ncbi:putative amino acid racemase [Metamycoplasma subdolum]|uniref:Putative amino acid racemase n=1 Tax=Metamycoplasma subdolum TaxID=92407 RepID=A0A3L9ZYL7_9BACT|nr:alanine/ornithine racemase family PLP-dependent enzyme [Metamycoplasma subdolum]RMA77540.1 putative amino acid racemase [Metamycoplasma subdolum]WPB50732.1 alanine/ornithine racemase family PLP-dependent enzyme [Metamycoplasma subdolum]
MEWPRIVINEEKFKTNVRRAIEICEERNVQIVAVTKGFVGNRRMAELYLEAGIKYFGDSRLENIEVYKDFKVHKQLLRIAQMHEVKKLVELCDSSLQTDISVIKKVSEESIKQGKIHEVILMVDLGDRREGVLPEEAVDMAGKIIKLKGVKLVGLGCNFGCYGARKPSVEAMNLFVKLQHEIEDKYKIKMTHMSGGNTYSFHMIWEKTMPREINFIRMGFGMIFGTEDMYRETIKGMYRDAFRCEARVVEVDYKSSLPVGECGIDAFGKKPYFEDKGMIKRVILALGKLDTMFDAMFPYDKDIIILGGSSDHMILDVTNSKKEYKINDIVTFALDWGSLLYLFNSKFVEKVFE